MKAESQALTHIPRIPETCATMDETESVNAFHEAGISAGVLEPLYYFNALVVSRRVPLNGVVLDLGSGSGQFISALAAFRPDIKIIAIELSDSMIALAEKTVKEKGLSARVFFHKKDMTKILPQDYERIDLVTSIFSFHHLPTHQLATEMMAAVNEIIKIHGCSFWLFDHVRTKTEVGHQLFPEAFSPGASPALKMDSKSSVAAAFTFSELQELLAPMKQYKVSQSCSKLFPYYQCHLVNGLNKWGVFREKNDVFSFSSKIQGQLFALVFGFRNFLKK